MGVCWCDIRIVASSCPFWGLPGAPIGAALPSSVCSALSLRGRLPSCPQAGEQTLHRTLDPGLPAGLPEMPSALGLLLLSVGCLAEGVTGPAWRSRPSPERTEAHVCFRLHRQGLRSVILEFRVHCLLPGFVAASSDRRVFSSVHLSSVHSLLFPGLGRGAARMRRRHPAAHH